MNIETAFGLTHLRRAGEKAIPNLKKKLGLKPKFVNTPEIQDGFKTVQRLAYACAKTIGDEIQEGWTEEQAAKLMDTYLRDCGVKSFFHRSVAWFGDRSGFLRFKHDREFDAGPRRYKEGDAAILDTAPIYKGFVGDIGYSFIKGQGRDNTELLKMNKDLIELRELIPLWFSSSASPATIWNQVDEYLSAHGYVNAHAKYPFSVLGHKVYKLPFSISEQVPTFKKLAAPLGIYGVFGLDTFASFISHGFFTELLSPGLVGDKTGFWAIEPHFALERPDGTGFGSKFEEILVVEPSGKAYWLDNEVPHLKYK